MSDVRAAGLLASLVEKHDISGTPTPDGVELQYPTLGSMQISGVDAEEDYAAVVKFLLTRGVEP